MNAEIEVKVKSALSIEEDAIVSHEGKDYIFIEKDNNKFEMTEIKKGTSENNFMEITAVNGSDLSKEKIVINGAYTLLMQLKTNLKKNNCIFIT